MLPVVKGGAVTDIVGRVSGIGVEEDGVNVVVLVTIGRGVVDSVCG